MTAFEEFRQLVELAKQRGWITPPPIRPRQGVTTRTPEEQKAARDARYAARKARKKK